MHGHNNWQGHKEELYIPSKKLLQKKNLEFPMCDDTVKLEMDMEVVEREDPITSPSKEVTALSSPKWSINLRTLVSGTMLARVR